MAFIHPCGVTPATGHSESTDAALTARA